MDTTPPTVELRQTAGKQSYASFEFMLSDAGDFTDSVFMCKIDKVSTLIPPHPEPRNPES